MKRLCFTAYLFVLSSLLFAQNTIRFNEVLPVTIGLPNIPLNNVLIVPGGYVIYGADGDSALAVKIDSTGKLLWAKKYYIKGYDYGYASSNGEGGIKIPWGGGGAVTSLSNDSTGFVNWSIFRYDDNGDTIWTRNYKDSTNMFVAQIKLTRDNKFLVGGVWVNFKNIQNWFETLVLIKTDSIGHKIWEKTYHDGNGYSVAYVSVDTCKDGGFIVAAYNYDTSYYCTGRIKIIKMDSTGKPQWTKYISGTPCDVTAGGVISLKHGGYMVCGSYDDSTYLGSGTYTELYMAKLSNTGSIVWSKQYGYPPPYQGSFLVTMRELNNGDIIAGGNGGDTNMLACILKVDSNGNQKWLRHYYNPLFTVTTGPVEYLTDIQLTPDGGYIATGYTYPYPEDIWVVKVDSNGCDSAGCDLTGVTELKIESGGVRVKPNPNNGKFIIQIVNPEMNSGQVGELLMVNEMQVEVYNVLGQKVFTSTLPSPKREGASFSFQINLSSQPNGIYLYRVISEKGNLIGERKFIIQK